MERWKVCIRREIIDNEYIIMGYNIDFFELMFLAESVIPPGSIARSVCFDRFSDVFYKDMRADEREQFLKHVEACHGFDAKNKQCAHFLARFRADNQYLVKVVFEGVEQQIECYLHEGVYKTSSRRHINPEYVVEVSKLES